MVLLLPIEMFYVLSAVFHTKGTVLQSLVIITSLVVSISTLLPFMYFIYMVLLPKFDT